MTHYPLPSDTAWSFMVAMLTRWPRNWNGGSYLPAQSGWLAKSHGALGYDS